MSKYIKSIRLEPKTVMDKMTTKSTLFSVYNLTLKDKLKILFSGKPIYFRISKTELRRMAR